MIANLPHYLLFAEASRNASTAQTWRFVLQNLNTRRRFTASDTEEPASGERLELLAVVRGLEALEGSARVTLVTRSRYVSRGIRSGLAQWRVNNWRWERFGKNVAVRDHDLWQRVDRALEFHQVDCQTWHFEAAALEPSATFPEQLVEPFSPELAALPGGQGLLGVHSPQVGAEMACKLKSCRPPKRWRALPRPFRQVLGASA